MSCKHHPNPRKYAAPRPVGSSHESYMLELVVQCAKCDVVGRVFLDVLHREVEWEDEARPGGPKFRVRR